MTKDNRLLRFAAAFLLCFGLMLSVLAVNAGAVSAYIWDGTTELQAGRTYYVVDTVKVRRDVIVPEGTKLSVRDGATLKISAAGSLTVNGELSAAIGGTIIN